LHRTFQFYIIEFGLEVEIVLLSRYIFLHNVIVALLHVGYSSKYGPCFFFPKLMVGIRVNSLKPEIDLICIYDLFLIHQKTLHFHYKDQPLSDVQQNTACLLWETYEAYIYWVWSKCSDF